MWLDIQYESSVEWKENEVYGLFETWTIATLSFIE